MASELSVRHRGQYLEVTWDEPNDLDEAVGHWRAIGDACEALGCFSVLVLVRFPQLLSRTDYINTVNALLAPLDGQRQYRIARVASEPPGTTYASLFEDSFRNHGVTVRAFKNAEDGRAWLIGRGDAEPLE